MNTDEVEINRLYYEKMQATMTCNTRLIAITLYTNVIQQENNTTKHNNFHDTKYQNININNNARYNSIDSSSFASPYNNKTVILQEHHQVFKNNDNFS